MYNSSLAACNKLCGIVDVTTNDIRQAMLMDMSAPSGQYADLSKKEDKFSIFYTDNQHPVPIYQNGASYLDEEGKPDMIFDPARGYPVVPGLLDPVQFAQNFKPSWAEALLKYHPEYCKLQEYEANIASYNWDKQFEDVETYQEALQKGFINPITSNKDPLVQPYRQSLLEKYNLYETVQINNQPHNVSMWQLASVMVRQPFRLLPVMLV